ncbi:MAG TPA: DNA polymerase III subunit delta' [Phycisphaerales bacterium]|nr:DNA polymerase III subunit delta' [Phycisphaerales bacterium]
MGATGCLPTSAETPTSFKDQSTGNKLPTVHISDHPSSEFFAPSPRPDAESERVHERRLGSLYPIFIVSPFLRQHPSVPGRNAEHTLPPMAKRSTKRKKTIEPENEPYAPLVAPSLECTLDEILGQPLAVETLDAALSCGRVHHAWIFHGPSGVGKFTTALAFAAVLLDPEAGPDLSGRYRPDPSSRVQGMLRAGTHPDLHVIVKELARFSSDDRVRNSKLTSIAKDVVATRLIEPAYRAPNMPGGLASKVFIVDEAELLDRSLSDAVSQNALLKTLEEPPEGTVLILVTSNEDRLLPTIRSRSQRVGFGPLDDESMTRWIERAGVDLPPDSGWLLRYAAGSPGRLLEAIDTGLLAWHEQLAPALDRALRGGYDPMLAPTMRDLVEGWATAWAAKDPKRSKEMANRAALARLFSLIAEHARVALRDPESAGPALAMIEAVQQAERRLASNVQPALVLEGLAADMPGPAAAV